MGRFLTAVSNRFPQFTYFSAKKHAIWPFFDQTACFYHFSFPHSGAGLCASARTSDHKEGPLACSFVQIPLRHSQCIAPIVVRIVRVTLHPMERDLMGLQQPVQGLP